MAFHSYATNLGPPVLTAGINVYVKDTQTGAVSAVTSNCYYCGGEYPSISADGRYVAFDSTGTNLVPGDTNGQPDVFVKDMSTGTITRVSVDSSGNQANGQSQFAGISPDGNYVAFQSDATNLVPNDTNGATDVFVHNMTSGQTIRVSVDSSGNQGNNVSTTAGGIREIVTNSGTVTFSSSATNLVSGDTNGTADPFVHTLAGQTTQGDLDNSGNEAPAGASLGAISNDGRYVAFWSTSNLVGGTLPTCFGTQLCAQEYVRDLQGNQSIKTTLVSSDSSGNPGTGDSNDTAFISAGDRYVSFGSNAANLVTGDTNNIEDVFLKDLQTGATNRLDVSSSGGQATGWYAKGAVLSSDALSSAFEAKAYGLVSPEPANRYQVYWRYNPTPSVPAGQLLGCLACQEARAAQALDSLGRALGVAGEPVNLANGSFYQSQRDAAMPNTGVPFTFTRAYNSADTTALRGVPPAGGSNEDQPIPMSQGWTSSYNIYLRQSDWSGDVVLHGADGQQVIFVKQASGSFLGGQGVGDTLTKNGDSS